MIYHRFNNVQLFVLLTMIITTLLQQESNAQVTQDIDIETDFCLRFTTPEDCQQAGCTWLISPACLFPTIDHCVSNAM